METKEIAKRETLLSPNSWATLKEQASYLIKSGFLPTGIKTPEQAIAVALTGRELGVGFMESIRGINVIQGKPTVSPQLMLALANRTGQLENIEINATNEGATVIVKRKGRTPHSESFGPTEAAAMGLTGKDNYKKQPKTMFKWRAVAANLRVTFPDVISGLYTPEEMGIEVTVNEEGDMEVVHPEPTSAATNEPELVQHPGYTVQATEVQEEPGRTPPSEEERMVFEVREMLGSLNHGDDIAMDAHLKRLTLYSKDGRDSWVKVADLERIGQTRPKWLRVIYGKVKDVYKRETEHVAG